MNTPIDNDFYVNSFTKFLTDLDANEIIRKIELAFKKLVVPVKYAKQCDDIIQTLKIYTWSLNESLQFVKHFCNKEQELKLEEIINGIRLYKIEAPFIANASNYGVPQNR